MCKTLFRVACVLGFLAVVAGTFGAHGLDGRVDPELLEVYEVGVRYHMFHALALLAIAAVYSHLAPTQARAGAWATSLGILVFSGSLYLMTLTGARWLGMITPLGGLGLLSGWVLFALAVRSAKPAGNT